MPRTETYSFGVSRREGHDSSKFYHWRLSLRPLERIVVDVCARSGGDWQSDMEELAGCSWLP